MTYVTSTPQDFASFDRGPFSPAVTPYTIAAVLALALGLTGSAWMVTAPQSLPTLPGNRETAAPTPVSTKAVQRVAAVTFAPDAYAPLFDPTSSIGGTPVSLSQTITLASTAFISAPSATAASVAKPETIVSVPAPVTEPIITAMVEDPPLPAPRPSEWRERAAPGPSHAQAGPAMTHTAALVPPASVPDNRTFIEKLFGMARPSGSALGYAAPEDGAFSFGHGLGSNPGASYGHSTAVYDIAAHTVYLPNGDRLEAHSGLRDRLDDPRHVNERMRGATPPQTYDLTLREQLFHGVQALRLNPVGGGGVFGRTGLLAHTYMLGPNGDSNGCISFRDYRAFLQAYLNGEVKRLVVVARQN